MEIFSEAKMVTSGKKGIWLIIMLALVTKTCGHMWGPRDTGRFCTVKPHYFNISTCMNTSDTNEPAPSSWYAAGMQSSTADHFLMTYCRDVDPVQTCFESKTNMCIDQGTIMEELREKQNICDHPTSELIHAYLDSQENVTLVTSACMMEVWEYLYRCNLNIYRSALELTELTLPNRHANLVEMIAISNKFRDSALECLFVLTPTEDLPAPECQRLTRENILLFSVVMLVVSDAPGMALTVSQLHAVQNLLISSMERDDAACRNNRQSTKTDLSIN